MSDERSFIALSIAILTVSDTRRLDEDRSGSLLVERLTEAGHKVADRQIVTDDVPDGALAIARERQVTKPGRGREITERNRAAKAAKADGKA